MAHRPDPKLWASRRPFGIGLQRPNNYWEVVRAALRSRNHPRYAWRVLTQGVCDGCALGTSGMKDWTLDGTHLCNVRLRLLELNTMDALDPAPLADVSSLAGSSAAQLRALGRLPVPLLRRAGEPGFTPVTWDTALDLCSERITATTPDRIAAFLTSRGMPNESYYAAQKALRALGSPNIDNAARICHSPSAYALRDGLGVTAATCSYTDLIGSDLVVFIGANPANNQPVTMKYLLAARRAGTRVVCVNPHREPGMDRYWVPSDPESALFGTKMTDRWFQVATGGDLAFLVGTLKALDACGGVDHAFVAGHTTGFDAASTAAAGADWAQLERGCGLPRGEMEAFAAELAAAKTCVLVWSMGATQHVFGEDNVRAIVNLALARGFVGREHCGLMPIRGHSGVQGGAEMGCYATSLPGHRPVSDAGAAELSALWGFDVPARRGLTAPEMLDAADAGELDVLISAGGNFLEVLPDPDWVRGALARIPLRVHLDIVLSPQMLVEPAGDVLVLPAATRYESPGGVTETSTERRVIFSPEIAGGPGRIGQARPEWQVFGDIAARARPDLAAVARFSGTAEIRAEIARVVPGYDRIAELRERGDQFQIGGTRLCEGAVFPTPDGLARFSPTPLPEPPPPDGLLRLSTRRAKQFNSMVQADRDGLTGAVRDDVLLNAGDAAALGIADGAPVVVRNAHGELRGSARVVPIRSGDVQVHWPEGNVLLGRERRSAESGVPDYNARVSVEPAG